MDAPGKDGNASMPEQVKRPNPWMMMMMTMMMMMMMTTTMMVMMLVRCRSNKYRAQLALAHAVRRRRAWRQAALRHLATIPTAPCRVPKTGSSPSQCRNYGYNS